MMVDNTVNQGAMTRPFMTFFTANGGRANEGRMMIDGLNVAASFNGGGVSTFIYDTANVEEMQVLVSGALGEAENGGPQVNLIPKSGGNVFKGTGFYSGAGDWSTGSNLDDELRSYGLTQPAGVISAWDTSVAGGGPIKRDRLWFFVNARKYSQLNPIPGAFANLNAGDATKWLYAKDPDVETRGADSRAIMSLRLTAQVTPRNRVTFSHEYQHRCSGSSITMGGDGCRTRGDDWIGVGSLTSSPESFPGYHDFPYHVTQATWTSPLTSRLLLEGGFSRFQYLWAGFGIAPKDTLSSLIPVTEQSTMYGQANFSYRGLYDPLAFAYADNDASPTNWRASAAYVTGAHNMKVGYQGSYQKSLQARVSNDSQLWYRFNGGVPNACRLLHRAAVGAERPHRHPLALRAGSVDAGPAVAAGRPALRPRGELGAGRAQRHDRDLPLQPAADHLRAHRERGRLQRPHPAARRRLRHLRQRQDRAAREPREVPAGGHQRRELLGQQPGQPHRDRASPRAAGWTATRTSSSIAISTTRWGRTTWPTGGDNCVALGGNDLNFGKSQPELDDRQPRHPRGLGRAPLRLAVRRVGAAGARAARVAGGRLQPALVRQLLRGGQHPDVCRRLPDVDGGRAAGPAAADRGRYGHLLQRHAGGVGARVAELPDLRNRLRRRAHAGTGTASTPTSPRGCGSGSHCRAAPPPAGACRDTCDLNAALPELLVLAGVNQQLEACDVVEPFLTTFRALAAYTVPKIDVLVSTNMRSVPGASLGAGSVSATNGTSLNANYNVPNLVVQQTLGRLPANGLANGTTSVNLLTPGLLYGERITQFDMRFAKVVRFGSGRADIGIDLYNVFNANTPTTFLQTYDYATSGATYLRPTAIVSPRFARFNVTVNF